ncbi:MAG: tRNA (guanosine(37)-N1)-methyltransferase TrmD [Clostridiales Family XIII bacterium]|jgi:tRNA (guanine37-N1)-methyltransferase|nr:tRNA (guanosine(37)-N1)-methyltransferase TrmD [Clostridiales Family XIII bacterium]
MKIQVLTLFPGMFAPVLSESILGRAREKGVLDVETADIREYTADKHKKTDDYPFGGGAGMVLMAQPVFDALRQLGAEGKRLIYMSPKGKLLDQSLIAGLAQEEEIVLLCGHYEGLDQRVLDRFNMEEISIGDYILTGGELPAMVLIDAVARMLPEVLGNPGAHDEESIYSGLLEYPQYTQPRDFRGMKTPEILLSGNHKWIRLWKFEESVKLTRIRRPDLFLRFLENRDKLDKDEKKILEKIEKDFLDEPQETVVKSHDIV